MILSWKKVKCDLHATLHECQITESRSSRDPGTCHGFNLLVWWLAGVKTDLLVQGHECSVDGVGTKLVA